MDSLCSFCEQIQFSVLGFHGPMFHPNAPIDSDDSFQPREETWQKSRKTPLSTVLESRKSCQFCRYIVQLFEDRLRDQDVIMNSVQELGAGGANIVVGYRNEPACNRNLPDWELTRLEVIFQVPENVIATMRDHFGIASHLDRGPILFIVLQRAGEGGKTLLKSIDQWEDYAGWYEEEGSDGLDADCLGKGRLRPPVFDPEAVHHWIGLCEEKHQAHPKSPCRAPVSSIERIFGVQEKERDPVPGLRVIDVVNMCIIEFDWEQMESYFALSYVWGTRRFVTLNKANEADLAKQDSLGSIELPHTIADAIAVMAEMYKRYLWVDSPCILQDDEADNSRMDAPRNTSISPSLHLRERSTWCEDIAGLDFTPFIDTFALLQLIASMRPLMGGRERQFRDLVTAYFKRKLTQRRDTLNGMSGILEELSKSVGPFFQGIPLACFTNAILWDRDFLWTGQSRPVDEESCREERDMRIPGLPSWSWVGWMCHIRFGKDFDGNPTTRLKFYGYTSNTGPMELETVEHKAAQKEDCGSDAGGWGRRNDLLPIEFWGQERTEVTREDLEGLKAVTPLLCFWTWTASIQLEASGKKKFFKTKTGRSVGFGMRTFVPPGQDQHLDLIVIGDYTYTQLSHKPAVAVIAIRWEEGIAYREPFGLETVAYSDWEEIEDRRWKMIVMG